MLHLGTQILESSDASCVEGEAAGKPAEDNPDSIMSAVRFLWLAISGKLSVIIPLSDYNWLKDLEPLTPLMSDRCLIGLAGRINGWKLVKITTKTDI